MLSNTSKYAIRAMIYIARHSSRSKRLGIKVIAKELQIPAFFLGKILQVLARKKLLDSMKGPTGGFTLGKPAERITLLQIIEAVDNTDFLNQCIIGNARCSMRHKPCVLHDKYAPIRDTFREMLAKETISDILKGEESAELSK